MYTHNVYQVSTGFSTEPSPYPTQQALPTPMEGTVHTPYACTAMPHCGQPFVNEPCHVNQLQSFAESHSKNVCVSGAQPQHYPMAPCVPTSRIPQGAHPQPDWSGACYPGIVSTPVAAPWAFGAAGQQPMVMVQPAEQCVQYDTYSSPAHEPHQRSSSIPLCSEASSTSGFMNTTSGFPSTDQSLPPSPQGMQVLGPVEVAGGVDLAMWTHKGEMPQPTLPFMPETRDTFGGIAVPKLDNKRRPHIKNNKCTLCKRLVQPGVMQCSCQKVKKAATSVSSLSEDAMLMSRSPSSTHLSAEPCSSFALPPTIDSPNWITAPQEAFCASPANHALRRANVPTAFDVTRLSPQFTCSNTMCTASTASAELDNSCKASPPSPQLDGTVASGKTTPLSTPGTPPSCASSDSSVRRVRRVLNKVSLEKLDICAADLSAVVIESLKEGRSDVADCVYHETFLSRGYAHVFAELYYKVCKAEASDLKASRFRAIMLEHLQNDFRVIVPDVLQSPDLEAAMMPAASAFSQKAISELAVASKTADGSVDCFKTEAVAVVKFLAALHSVSLVGSRTVVDCVADLLTKVEETFVTSAKTVTPFASMLVETLAACLESIAWDKVSSFHDLSKASSDIQSRVTALSKCSCFRLSVLLENALSAMN
ncbi:hypothetical protein DIPPA_19924 [Diplonema papillatum]|nr:hypothetical protein DIPPA_19924 [Diplonema papillatum]